MSSCGANGCDPIGVGVIDSFAVSLLNVGGEKELYVNTTGPDPFEIRTLLSSDASLKLTQFAQTIDFSVDTAAIVSLLNLGAGAEVWDDATGPNPFELRSITSPLGSVSVVQTATEIELEVSDPGGAQVFQEDTDDVDSTTSTTYQTLVIIAGDVLVQDGETWKINMCLAVCHPINVFTVNTFVRWSVETAAGVFTEVDEWQINAPITIAVDTPSMPFHRTVRVEVVRDTPRMLVEFRMSAVQASATQVEMARWGGVFIEDTP